MKQEIKPQESIRAEAFELWMSSPMPMVTLTKTFDVTKVVKVSKKLSVGFNALLCWCIAKVASQMEVFYLLPEGGKLFRYDSLAINVIVKNRRGGINSCDIPFEGDMKQFIEKYKDFVFYNDATEGCSPEITAVETLKFALRDYRNSTLDETSSKTVLAVNIGKLQDLVEDDEFREGFSDLYSIADAVANNDAFFIFETFLSAPVSKITFNGLSWQISFNSPISSHILS